MVINKIIELNKMLGLKRFLSERSPLTFWTYRQQSIASCSRSFTSKVYVEGLPAEWSAADVANRFSGVGNINTVSFVFNKLGSKTGKGKFYSCLCPQLCPVHTPAILQYEDQESAKAAVNTYHSAGQGS